jgi:hypothetical protein
MLEGPWAKAGATAAILVLLLAILDLIRRGIRYFWLGRPVKAHFRIPPLGQIELEHVVQDDRGHAVSEMVLPSHSRVEVEIEYVPRISFGPTRVSFGCEGDDINKPIAKERFDRVVAVGKDRWIPGCDEGHVIDRHGFYHANMDRAHPRRSRNPIGFLLQTKAAGTYDVRLYFFLKERVGVAQLTIKVEDRPRSRMRCLDHIGCWVRPAINRNK